MGYINVRDGFISHTLTLNTAMSSTVIPAVFMVIVIIVMS